MGLSRSSRRRTEAGYEVSQSAGHGVASIPEPSQMSEQHGS
jgi:hypothetical protein